MQRFLQKRFWFGGGTVADFGCGLAAGATFAVLFAAFADSRFCAREVLQTFGVGQFIKTFLAQTSEDGAAVIARAKVAHGVNREIHIAGPERAVAEKEISVFLSVHKAWLNWN